MDNHRANKLIIDVTQLVHWPGKLTGIPRVMNELTLRYADQDNCLFVVWDRENQAMYEVDIVKTLKNRGSGITFTPNSQGSVSRPSINPVLASVKVGALPKKIAKKMLSKLDARGQRLAGGVRSKLKSRHMAQYKIVTPVRGDKLFILWGEQHDSVYIEKLKSYNESGVKLVQISYDMLPLVTPQYSGHSTDSMRNYSRQIFPIVKLILAISEHTRKDINFWMNSVNLTPPKVEVFRLGDDFKLSKPTRPGDDRFMTSGLKGGDYALCVGTIEARKNHTLLYYTYKLAAEKSVKLPKIVVVGRRGWLTENIYELITNDPSTKESFIFLENISDEELSWLYKNCLFNVYPSFYEGWGLPIAESIAYGAPTISSNTSSMPEIAGNLIDYFSPVSPDECLVAMRKLTNSQEREKARARIQKYKTTSWEQTFSQVEDYIRRI